ncbi:hypothetical protein VQ360_003806 [Salmonella enterica]|nr:hypothetical protein [Salmonella enterica]EKC2597428.1 hypothetical protein [Salmonella enterica]EMD3507981.1 hypothetical protein [Salmonella enterica]EMD4682145.1 hypothetical protein [Salmonella enterica]EMD4827702.1 hypothetical protein [Salmonella enterica]
MQMTEVHGDSVVIYRGAVIHGFCTAEIVIFSRFPQLWNLVFQGASEYTGINGVCGAAEPKRQLRGSIEWSITVNQSVAINGVFCSTNGQDE